MQGLEELVELEHRLSRLTDTSASLRLIVESAVRLTGGEGGALWVGDPGEPDTLATLVCAVGATPVERNRFAPEDDSVTRRAWTPAERRQRISSVPAVMAGKTAGVLTIFHPESVPDHEAELVLQLLAARAGTILASAESRERLTARDEFVAVAAHQLRTPLTVLRLELHAMERGLRTSGPNGTRLEQARQALERATRQCDRVQRIGEHLLDLLELRTPHLALQRSLTDLGELARAVAARLVDELAHARCGLVMNIQPGAVGAWDRARLEQVVSALLMNTAKHAPGSRVELSVQANDSAAMLSVRDEGQGITAEDAAHIFDRFERASSNDPVGGWGLGLFLCRRVVEAHGGTIRVLSSPGAGATFVVELPRGAPLDLRALRAHDAMPS